MPESASWRELLARIIEQPGEKERIAAAIGINAITLTRWISGQGSPRPQRLVALLKAVPYQYQEELQRLLQKDGFLASEPAVEERSLHEIPYNLIHEVLETRAHSYDHLRFWALCSQVLQHALRHLDFESAGMTLSVVRCMPPAADSYIHSLHESLGMGTAPWASGLQPRALFLGANSLSGYAASRGYFMQVEDLKTQTTFVPAFRTEYEVSAAACPIMFGNRVAGCLLLSSTRPDYFLSEARQFLIQGYTNLLALAFEPEEFYPPARLSLSVMPSLEVQQPYLAGFRQRVVSILNETVSRQQPLTVTQAEQRAWQQIEELLLHLVQ